MIKAAILSLKSTNALQELTQFSMSRKTAIEQIQKQSAYITDVEPFNGPTKFELVGLIDALDVDPAYIEKIKDLFLMAIWNDYIIYFFTSIPEYKFALNKFKNQLNK